jgi:hypothetical protein
LTDVLSSVPAGHDVSDGPYPAWCLQKGKWVKYHYLYQATLYASTDPNLPPDVAGYPYDKINWVLNHRGGAIVRDIQYAIWYFTGSIGYPGYPGAQALIQDANLNGPGYVPGPGEIIAVVAYIGPKLQATILELELPCEFKLPPVETQVGVTMYLSGIVSYITDVLSLVPPGYAVTDGPYPAWCLQKGIFFNDGQLYMANLYDSTGPNLPPDVAGYPWDKINWILNHKDAFSVKDIQYAIWYLTGTMEMPGTAAKFLIQAANAHGVGYVPGPGDILAVVVYIAPNIQGSIIEVKYECL